MMSAFWILSAVAIISAWRMVAGSNPVHALLNLIVCLLAIAGLFFLLGAPFAAALEILVYAGAILVLFVFVVMMLNLGKHTEAQERSWQTGAATATPWMMSALLLITLYYIVRLEPSGQVMGQYTVAAKQVGIMLFGPYLIMVELASVLLLSGLVAAYHIGKKSVNAADAQVAQREELALAKKNPFPVAQSTEQQDEQEDVL